MARIDVTIRPAIGERLAARCQTYRFQPQSEPAKLIAVELAPGVELVGHDAELLDFANRVRTIVQLVADRHEIDGPVTKFATDEIDRPLRVVTDGEAAPEAPEAVHV